MEYITSLQKPLIGSKIFLAVAMLFSCFGGLAIGFVIGVINKEPAQTQLISPTSAPIIRPANTIAPTSELDSEQYKDWQEYFFTDCQIKLYAPTTWKSGLRGANGACGILYTPDTIDQTNFDSVQGVKFMIAKVGSDFIYDFDESSFNPVEYGKKLASVTGTPTAKSDKLLMSDQFSLRGFDSKHLQLDRTNFGKADYLFYKINNDWYVIIWGGSSSINNADLTKILASVKKI